MYEDETSLDTMTSTETGNEDDLFLFLDDDEGDNSEQEPESQNEPAETFTVKYNGKEQQLTREELIANAQKGMNYDHVKGELDNVREGNVYKAMKAYADKAGMSIDEAATFLLESAAADAELEEEQSIRNQYGNLPGDVIKELVASRTAEKRAAATAKAESEQQKAWAEALDAYPDLTMDNVPQSVLDAVAKGATPLMALKDNEIASLRQQLKNNATQKQNDLNRARSVGSVRGGGTAEKDPFLSGFGY